jgi:hypothetical protein
VIVPSVPGFGFSTPLPDDPDMNFWKVAVLWHTLMTGILGYDRYAAGGCDVGALVTGQLGHKYAGELDGIHIGSGQKLTLFNGDRAWDLSGGLPIPDGLPAEIRAQVVALEKRFAVHLAALTHAMIFWVGNAIGTSIRTYANNNRYPWTPSHDRWPAVEAPTGITWTLRAAGRPVQPGRWRRALASAAGGRAPRVVRCWWATRRTGSASRRPNWTRQRPWPRRARACSRAWP